MHQEVREFVAKVRRKYPKHFLRQSVLEVGSRDINGHIWDLFDECAITGVDVVPGPNVTVVSLAHMYRPEALYDVVLSLETLEHDPYWQETLKTMVRLTRPGGLLLGTCATTGRPEHGTEQRVGEDGSVYGPVNSYYKNLVEDDITTAVGKHVSLMFEVHPSHPAGLYWYGLKV